MLVDQNVWWISQIMHFSGFCGMVWVSNCVQKEFYIKDTFKSFILKRNARKSIGQWVFMGEGHTKCIQLTCRFLVCFIWNVCETKWDGIDLGLSAYTQRAASVGETDTTWTYASTSLCSQHMTAKLHEGLVCVIFLWRDHHADQLIWWAWFPLGHVVLEMRSLHCRPTMLLQCHLSRILKAWEHLHLSLPLFLFIFTSKVKKIKSRFLASCLKI